MKNDQIILTPDRDDSWFYYSDFKHTFVSNFMLTFFSRHGRFAFKALIFNFQKFVLHHFEMNVVSYYFIFMFIAVSREENDKMKTAILVFIRDASCKIIFNALQTWIYGLANYEQVVTSDIIFASLPIDLGSAEYN